MNRTFLVLSLVALAAIFALTALDPALARARHKAKRVCADRPYEFSWNFLAFGGPTPHGNGCAPAVYSGGRYVGQDPDPNIRAQLRRDPRTGYYMDY